MLEVIILLLGISLGCRAARHWKSDLCPMGKVTGVSPDPTGTPQSCALSLWV